MNNLKIISWNIACLPKQLNIFRNPNKMIKNILTKIKCLNADVICLQEVFENSLKEKIINELSDNQPYYLLGDTYKRYLVGEDSGLMVLSKYPIEFVKEQVLEEYNFPDRMANKTILYFKFVKINTIIIT